jgi:hypothetical protein
VSFPLSWLLSRLGYLRRRPLASEGKDLRGRVAVVTGANTGIGKQTAMAFARQVCTR